MRAHSQAPAARAFAVILVAISFLSAFPAVTFAAPSPKPVLTPAVIDGKGKVREIMKYTITLENPTEHLLSVYPWVTDVDPVKGLLGGSDLSGSREKEVSESLARWIEVTRGVVDLLPGEKREVPVLIQIHHAATPGIYHAAVHFSEGPNRPEAEKNSEGTVSTAINIEVLEDAHVRLELGNFTADERMFSGDDAGFSYRIKNIGNRGVVPSGKIRIFDKSGEEVAAVDVNTEGKRIEPDASLELASAWSAGSHFGKYKALLDLEYGDRGTLQDTVFFWMLPWGKLISYFFVFALAAVILGIVFHSYFVSSRAARPAYAEEALPGFAGRIARIVSERKKRRELLDDQAPPPTRRPSLDELREEEIPPPARTRPGRGGNSGGIAPVALSARPKVTPPPEHIVHLKRR